MTPGGKPVVLVVDDDAAVGRILKRQLETRGYEILSASSSKAAIHLLEDASRHPDVILMDARLGPESGLAAIAGMTSRCKARVVIMSGDHNAELHRNALIAGARATVLKPFDFAALDALLRALASRT